MTFENSFSSLLFVIDESKQHGCVYLLQCAGTRYFKIGCTTSDTPHNRVDNMQTGCPLNIVIIAYAKTTHHKTVERLLHIMLRRHQVQGEWFELNDLNAKFAVSRLLSLSMLRSGKELLIEKILKAG
ncbi:hypothetical protein LCGC14_2429660 [marine sediment metagenome]|uniref:Bacteriophage T5 Orf172 DNA-binding domain-containing protein n=1 Tax=marine sediment metagenome TaxID=412755 RepID=A0A0F9C9L1_9ZZZZ